VAASSSTASGSEMAINLGCGFVVFEAMILAIASARILTCSDVLGVIVIEIIVAF
jgi:hypothetical protein